MSSLEFYLDVEEINSRIIKRSKSERLKKSNPLEEGLEKDALEIPEKIRRSH